MSLHQGGIVRTPKGQTWGFSMMDYNSVGRLTCLSPVTWKDGWPYFGLPGNLKRTPRTWVKPDTGHTGAPHVPYERNDDFSGPLNPIWQWNHVPDNSKWSLQERPGYMRLHSLPADSLWQARNTLTQRSIGPVSIPTVELDTRGLQPGDTAGLALMNLPFAWIGVQRQGDQTLVQCHNQFTDDTASTALAGSRIWLRAHCDFLTEEARFSYSTDGQIYAPLGPAFTMVFQLRTFQGVRYSLFNYNVAGAPGGYADFDQFTVDEPHPRGLMRPIPLGQTITLAINGRKDLLGLKDGKLAPVSEGDAGNRLQVVDRGLGRVALQFGRSFLSVHEAQGPMTLRTGEPGDAETFQWTENVYGDLILMSRVTHRHLRVSPETGTITADHPGPLPNRQDGSCFTWQAVEAQTSLDLQEYIEKSSL